MPNRPTTAAEKEINEEQPERAMPSSPSRGQGNAELGNNLPRLELVDVMNQGNQRPTEAAPGNGQLNAAAAVKNNGNGNRRVTPTPVGGTKKPRIFTTFCATSDASPPVGTLLVLRSRNVTRPTEGMGTIRLPAPVNVRRPTLDGQRRPPAERLPAEQPPLAQQRVLVPPPEAAEGNGAPANRTRSRTCQEAMAQNPQMEGNSITRQVIEGRPRRQQQVEEKKQ